MEAIAAGFFGLIGLALGGGLQWWQDRRTRKAQAEAVFSALTAEVEALVRLIRHRNYLPMMQSHMEMCEAMIADGRGDEQAPMFVLSATFDFFQTYNALVGQIGVLHPYWADRITRFYTYAKSVLENYKPDSPFQAGVPAEAAVHLFRNDSQLLEVVVQVGEFVSRMKDAKPPKGITDPFHQPALDGPPEREIEEIELPAAE